MEGESGLERMWKEGGIRAGEDVEVGRRHMEGMRGKGTLDTYELGTPQGLVKMTGNVQAAPYCVSWCCC